MLVPSGTRSTFIRVSPPEVKPRLGAQGLFSNIVCGKAFGDQMRKQVDEYTTIAREAKIKME